MSLIFRSYKVTLGCLIFLMVRKGVLHVGVIFIFHSKSYFLNHNIKLLVFLDVLNVEKPDLSNRSSKLMNDLSLNYPAALG